MFSNFLKFAIFFTNFSKFCRIIFGKMFVNFFNYFLTCIKKFEANFLRFLAYFKNLQKFFIMFLIINIEISFKIFRVFKLFINIFLKYKMF